MEEIKKILELVHSLEAKVQQLEKENRELKFAIISACDSLTKQNHDMSMAIDDDEGEYKAVALPSFKSPKWLKK